MTAELEEIEKRLAYALRRSAASPVLAAPDPGQAFLDAPVDVAQAVARSVVRVEILPNARRGAAWTPQRVKITPIVEPSGDIEK